VSRCEEHVYKFLLQKKQVRKKLSHQNIWASICTWQFQLNDTYMCQSNQCWRSVLTLWRPAKKGIFGKKHRNTRLWAGITPLLYGLQTWSKCQKTQQVF